ncbi:MAG: hypothetical protein QM752_00215 [Gammaproteobacteria bacterium]
MWLAERLPYDDHIDMEKILNALCARNFIVKYEVDGEYYGCIPSWTKHQIINHREASSALPAVETGKIIKLNEDLSSNERNTALKNHELSIQYTEVNCETFYKNETFSSAMASFYNQPSKKNAVNEHHASITRAYCMDQASEACPGMPGGKGKGNGREKEREEEQEVEWEKKQETNNLGEDRNIVVQARPRPTDSAQVLKIFEHWKTVLQHPNAVLDEKRKRVIKQALQRGFTAEQLCQAIECCALTPHNMGENDRGQRYDGLHVIFRDADQIERFIRNFTYPPNPQSSADKILKGNIAAGQNWLNRK